MQSSRQKLFMDDKIGIKRSDKYLLRLDLSFFKLDKGIFNHPVAVGARTSDFSRLDLVGSCKNSADFFLKLFQIFFGQPDFFRIIPSLKADSNKNFVLRVVGGGDSIKSRSQDFDRFFVCRKNE